MINRCLRLTALVVIAALVALSPLTSQPTAHAHGGVIIDGGFTDDYEWIAMASPFPVTPGETILTILVYDIETYAPINGLVPTLELARPSAPQPCCQDDTTLGPLPLVVDPVLYPGDYSNITLLLQEGTWNGRFTIDASDPVGPGKKTEFFFDVEVRAQAEGEERPTPVDAPSIALTATAIAPSAYPAPVGGQGGEGGNSEPANGEATEGTSNSTIPAAGTAPESIAPKSIAPESTATGNDASNASEGESTNGEPSAAEEGVTTGEEAAEGEAGEAEAVSTPYPAPAEAEAPSSGPSITLPAGDPPAAAASPNGADGRSWAVDNIWLLAALALVPILLVVFWLLLSGKNDNEWTGEPEE